MNTGSILTGAIAPVMVWVISLGGTARAFFAQWFIGLVFSIYSGPLFAFMPGKVGAGIRFANNSTKHFHHGSHPQRSFPRRSA